MTGRTHTHNPLQILFELCFGDFRRRPHDVSWQFWSLQGSQNTAKVQTYNADWSCTCWFSRLNTWSSRLGSGESIGKFQVARNRLWYHGHPGRLRRENFAVIECKWCKKWRVWTIKISQLYHENCLIFEVHKCHKHSQGWRSSSVKIIWVVKGLALNCVNSPSKHDAPLVWLF